MCYNAEIIATFLRMCFIWIYMQKYFIKIFFDWGIYATLILP